MRLSLVMTNTINNDTDTTIRRRGLMLALSSPSGAGKTTISRKLLERNKNLILSISTTTRPIRPAERDGIDYIFTDVDTFQKDAENGKFLEYAKVFGNYYGTPFEVAENTLCQGKDILFDIDWQGTQQIAQKARQDLVSIFILPPSVAELQRRLIERSQDPMDVVKNRMSQASDEMSHWAEYDYIIINRDINKSVHNVEAILEAERLKRERQVGLPEFVNQLREEAVEYKES